MGFLWAVLARIYGQVCCQLDIPVYMCMHVLCPKGKIIFSFKSINKQANWYTQKKVDACNYMYRQMLRLSPFKHYTVTIQALFIKITLLAFFLLTVSAAYHMTYVLAPSHCQHPDSEGPSGADVYHGSLSGASSVTGPPITCQPASWYLLNRQM